MMLEMRIEPIYFKPLLRLPRLKPPRSSHSSFLHYSNILKVGYYQNGQKTTNAKECVISRSRDRMCGYENEIYKKGLIGS